MFDDFKQSSDAFGDDDRAVAAARADAVAMTDHRAADASARHELISRPVWRSLRTLGIGGGRMLVIGQDAEVFAGLPAPERRLAPGSSGGFAATIPSDGWRCAVLMSFRCWPTVAEHPERYASGKCGTGREQSVRNSCSSRDHES